MDDMMRQGMGMMGKMMGRSNSKGPSGDGSSMDHMMKHGMGEGRGSMMQMCQNMTQSVAKSADMASFATEEIRGLFQDWLGQVETEVLTFIEGHGGQIDIGAIASQLSISEKSSRFIVGSLFQRGALDLGQVHVKEALTTQPMQKEEPEESTVADTKDE